MIGVNQTANAIAILAAYRSEIDAIYALHIDACSGFHHVKTQLENFMAVSPPTSSAGYRVQIGVDVDPNRPNAKYQHVATSQEILDRNAKEGRNEQRLRQACIVFAYMHWEDHVRSAFSQAVGVSKNDIKSPVFADLKRLRHAIAHNKSVLKDKLEVLPNNPTGVEVSFTHAEFADLMRALTGELERLAREYIGVVADFSFDHQLYPNG
jgi:hypothetical protein